MKTEFDLKEEEIFKMVLNYIQKCKNEELTKLIYLIKGEMDSRMAHMAEGWEKYWRD